LLCSINCCASAEGHHSGNLQQHEAKPYQHVEAASIIVHYMPVSGAVGQHTTNEMLTYTYRSGHENDSKQRTCTGRSSAPVWLPQLLATADGSQAAFRQMRSVCLSGC
jgi:hypothetical protein